MNRATMTAEKVDGAGRHAGQVELCDRHCDFVIAWERGHGIEVSDRRND